MYSASNRPVGLTQDAGWEVGARRTMALVQSDAWALLISPLGLRCWLGELADLALTPGAQYQLPDGTRGEIRAVSGAHLRLTWQPPGWERPSTIQVRVIAQGGRTLVAFHQEHLHGPEARAERRTFFHAALDALEQLAAE